MFLIVSALVVVAAAAVLLWCIQLSQSVSERRMALARQEQLMTAVLRLHSATEQFEASILEHVETGRTDQQVAHWGGDVRQARQRLNDLRTPAIEQQYAQQLRQIDERLDALLARADAYMSGLLDGASSRRLAADYEQAEAALVQTLNDTIAATREERSRLDESLAHSFLALQRLAIVGLASAIILAFVLVLSWYHNTAQQRRAVKRLRESEDRFRLLAENIPGTIYLCENDERYTMRYLNEAVEELTGYSRDEFLEDRLSFVELFHPDDKPYIAPIVDQAIAAHRPFQLRYRLRHRDGGWKWIEEFGAGVFHDGKLEYLEGVLFDITDRKQAEQELEHQRRYLRQVIDINPSFIFAKDRDGRFTLVNRALADAYGTSVEQLLGKTDADFNPSAEEVEHFRRDDLRVMDTGRQLVIPEESVTDKDGRTHWVQTVKRPIVGEDGSIDQVLGVATDITDLKRAELTMAWRGRVLERLAMDAPIEEVLEMLVQSAEHIEPTVRGIIYLYGANDHVQVIASPAMGAATQGRIESTLAGMNGEKGPSARAVDRGERVLLPDLDQADGDPCLAVLREAGYRSAWIEPIRSSEDETFGVFALYSTSSRMPEESHLEVMEAVTKIAAIAIQRRNAEEDLRESQMRLRAADRLASIGMLTAGLGHDMNNVLFPLRCRLDAIDWENLPEQSRDVLTAVRDTVNYLQQLSDGLRMLASDPDRSEEVAGASTSLDHWWPQITPLITDALNRRVKLEQDIPADLPPVRVQEHRLTQAVMNLVINASEASADGSPVRVWARHDRANNTVQIGVTDQGAGMTEEVRNRALDPFFTTKARSLSTGLGLSLVHGVVKSVGGSIRVDSGPGRGTTVTLTFPTAEPVGEGSKPPAGTRQAVISVGSAHLAAWVAGVLQNSGYTVQRRTLNGEPPSGQLWVTEPGERNLDIARRFVDRSPAGQVIVLGEASEQWAKLGAVVVRTVDDLEAIRSAVQRTLVAGQR